jgi:NAD(P)-dependent dehydrogenase (short-subunit alcohol dehydrogenase family)
MDVPRVGGIEVQNSPEDHCVSQCRRMIQTLSANSEHSLPGDITKKDDIQRLVKEVESKEPKGIHLLVNNAGITRDDNTSILTASGI